MFKYLLVCYLIYLSKVESSCSWNSCPSWSSDKNNINVHIISHTHDDLGWIKTVDEYYFGTKNYLVPVGVQYIFDSVIKALESDETRKFSFAETGFLWRWIKTRGEEDINRLKKLISKGQIELIGGGWVQNDEATSHYIDIIQQMSLGLRYLNKTFGECGRPKVAWQIDPFGHSKEMSSLFSLMGYEALFFGREHYLEHQKRINEKSLEFIWKNSDDLKTNLLTGVFYLATYAPLSEFCFDSLCRDDSIIDDKRFPGYNLEDKLQKFMNHINKQLSVQRHNNIMFMAGGDFQYSNAEQWYRNLDILIKNVRERYPNVKIFYSTPSCYVKALKESKPTLPAKTADFFPYAHREHSYWTGYFTSKPSMKRIVRKSSNLLNLLNKFIALSGIKKSTKNMIPHNLERSIALAQHHDAIT
uniref:Alpha-mann_mid domain-containing protein n=1 Tax=Strongyloides papillosus TaxID=174720 RepID=A0A0N5C7C3_STREA